ncbi:MAG: RNA polymerase sigma factor [Planctomycetaceae bacterium]
MAADDNELLAGVARGDRQAFEALYVRHKNVLMTAVVYLLGGDRSLAEDVLHDVFVSLAQHAHRIELRSSLKNYLLTSCLNRARDVLRSRRVQSFENAGLNNLAGRATMLNGEDWPATACEVALALARLPQEQREVVTLHVHGGQTFREIAEMLSISINTAQSRYRYALANLRKQLAERNAGAKGRMP